MVIVCSEITHEGVSVGSVPHVDSGREIAHHTVFYGEAIMAITINPYPRLIACYAVPTTVKGNIVSIKSYALIRTGGYVLGEVHCLISPIKFCRTIRTGAATRFLG